MTEKSNWVAWIAVLALIVAVIALVFILSKGSVTGEAILGSWRENIKNLSFETTDLYSANPELFLKVPVQYLTSSYRLHGTSTVVYRNLSYAGIASRSLMNWDGDKVQNFCNEDHSTPEFCYILIARENKDKFVVSSADYIYNNRGGKIIAGGFFSNDYDGRWWGGFPDYKAGKAMFGY